MLAGLSLVLGAQAGCTDDDAPRLGPGECSTVVWGTPFRATQTLSVRGSWDDWTTAIPMRPFTEPPWQLAEFGLSPGVYGYLVIEEGRGRVDPTNPLTRFRDSDGLEVSRLEVDECARPHLRVEEVSEDSVDGFSLSLRMIPAHDGAAVDPEGVEVRLTDGTPLQLEAIDQDTQTLRLRASGRRRGKHRVHARVRDQRGRETETVDAVGWVGAMAPLWADGIVYQIMIDRFRGDGGATLAPPANPGARAGGTLDGITAELSAGTFEAMGVSALWLSPVYVNPTEARPGRDDDHLYEGYHGYWPLDSRAVDPRIGGEAALDALIDEAHAAGVRVLLDLVPNHLYEDNPRVAEHRAAGWFHEHDPPCVCGASDCPWDGFIQVCWFTPYLPDLRFQQPEVMELAVEDARWWHERFDTDGFRIDAVPMMPRAVSRRIVHALRQQTGPRAAAFSLGEIFTGPGASGTEIIRYHLGPDGLDSAFDFPLMWAIRDALTHEGTGFDGVEASLAYTDAALQGAGALMATMVGNHDVTRFISEAQGDAGGDPWSDPPPQPVEPPAYDRAKLALGLVLTLPGLPVLLYGDEVGLAGGADPDNRRVMPDDTDLNAAQLELRRFVRQVAGVRRCVPALRRGGRRAAVVTADHYAFVRDGGDGAPAVVVLSRDPVASTVDLPAGSTPVLGWYKDLLSDERIEVGSAGASVPMEPRSLRILVPETFTCG